MSKNKELEWDIDEQKPSARDDNRPIELCRKPTLSLAWEKAKELFGLE